MWERIVAMTAYGDEQPASPGTEGMQHIADYQGRNPRSARLEKSLWG